ncbi:MAG: hypothetical protein OXC37_04955 [Bdellovibrionaceae bacterium]|nr:hypothetical protein [Pseudobdellovibrionaceae bacterium]
MKIFSFYLKESKKSLQKNKKFFFIKEVIGTKKTTLLLVKILEKITAHKDLHAKFLNTLSYLEYIGARKMLKSLPAPILNKTFLDHINEEVRHSLVLKNLAEKLTKTSYGFKKEELIAGAQGSQYFQEVDHYGLKFSSANPVLNYLYTTYAIEQRAIVLYSLYNDTLKKKGFSFSMKSILNDEEEHLDYTLKQIQKEDSSWETNLEEISQFEHQKYFSFLISLEEEVSKFILAPHIHSLKAKHYTSSHKV